MNNAILVVTIGFLINRFFPPKVQLITFIILAVVFVIGICKEITKRDNKTDSYVYYGGIPLIIIFIMYLLGKTYFNWNKDILEYLSFSTILPILYIIIAGIRKKLKSNSKKDRETVQNAIILSVILIVLTIFVVVSYFFMDK